MLKYWRILTSGASIHSTSHDIGFVDQEHSAQSMIVGNGGLIRGIRCNTLGEEQFMAKLLNVFLRQVGTETAVFATAINSVHKKLGHSNDESTRKTAAALNMNLTRSMKPCLAC